MMSPLPYLLGLTLWLAVNPLDGTWCSPDGQRISVAGLEVTTPGGQRSKGRYSLQAFSFEVPAGEWNAGATIWMERKSENTARVSTMTESQRGPPPHGLWQRCTVVSSRT